MVRVVLRAMKVEGLIVPTGKGRSARWQKASQVPNGSDASKPATAAGKTS
jgi:hypothetical protein